MNSVKSIILALLALLVIAAAIGYGLSFNSAGEAPENAQGGSGVFETGSEAREPLEEEPAAESSASALSNAKQGWGLGPSRDELGRPLDALNAESKYAPLDAYFIMSGEEKLIYLTFDLGYENGYTPSIIDTLDEHGVKAVFFITDDYIDEAPEVVERIAKTGHTLANHTVNHPSMPDVDEARGAEEIRGLHERVLNEFGYEMRLFRFPMGEFSERCMALVQEQGYASVFWSFAYKDWVADSQPDEAQSLQKLMDNLHPGAIYLLHAVSSTNDAILGDFIIKAREAGYDFALVDEALGLAPAATRAGESDEAGII
ncbi:MAG: polysaccharide deacetylase family protein [Oscillospiraceae bacterium]|nr:polysaccharide deacetylase family protein [Oscillospiraceae bacterium]